MAERHWLLTTDFAEALTIGPILARARANIFPPGWKIFWGTIAQETSPFLEQAFLPVPMTGLPQWGPPVTDLLGLYWEYDDMQGGAHGKLFKGIDATEWKGDKWKRAPFFLPAGIPPLPLDPTTATKEELFANTFCTFRQYTGIMRRPRSGGFNITAPQRMLFRFQGSYRSFRKWKALSWEAVPWTNAPPFSPCGMIVGVGRNAFYAQVRFYPGGPVQWMHFYYAAGAAQMFPLPHIFWGRFRDMDVQNMIGPGEITGSAFRRWSNGRAFGSAAGDHYTGTAQQFVGQFTPDWTPLFPTPAGLRPACDAPALPAGQIRGGVGAGGMGTWG